MKFENSLAFAKKLDREDELKSFRSKFHLPKVNGKTAIYFTGNSLGLQPKSTKKMVDEELEDWAKFGVEGHLDSRRPWLYYHKFAKKALAQIVGAKATEVVAMNQLTVNLHLMMVSFFKPTKDRFKIITEHGAFPSDQYAVESQLKFHGFHPDEALIEIKPRAGEATLRTEDILKAIQDHQHQLALVIFGGVQYYTGQLFDIKKITEAAHQAGAFAGSPVQPGAMCAYAPYDLENVKVVGYDVVTNRPKVAAYRAPGGPISEYAVESVIDEIAGKIGMDPLELRLKNAAKQGTKSSYGPVYGPIGLGATLEAARKHPHMSAPLGPNQGRGMACGFWFNFGGQTCTDINIGIDGTVTLTVGTIDVGGSRAALSLVAAEELGVPYSQIKCNIADTGSLGHNDMTDGSRGTFSSSMATVFACRNAIKVLRDRAAKMMDIPVEDVVWEDGHAKAKEQTNKAKEKAS